MEELNITRRVAEAVGTLPKGWLIRESRVTMFDAMNGLEIMDPKMDTGALHNNSTADTTLLFDPQASLSAEDACWIVDEMVTREVAWHCGQMLSQTVLCGLLYHLVEDQYASLPPPDAVVDQHRIVVHLLLHYAILYRQCVDLAYNELAKNNVKEGEDCMLDHADMPLHSCENVERVLDLTVELLQLLNRPHEPWMEQLIRRVALRADVLACLHSLTVESATSDHHPRSLLSTDIVLHLDLPDPTSHCLSYFDDSIESALPQNMPPPIKQIPSHRLAASHLRDLLDTARELRTLRNVSDFSVWQAMAIHTAQTQSASSLKRSLVKTCLSAGSLDGKDRREAMFAELLHRHTHLSLEPILAIPSGMSDGKDRIKFGVWWDLIRGYTLSYASASLQNEARSRRGYLSLATAWFDRIATIDDLSQYSPMLQLRDLLHALRLDCLLIAYLFSWRLGMVAADEDLQMWWMIAQITENRLKLRLRDSIEQRRARLWRHIAAAFCIILGQTPKPTLNTDMKGRAQFALRHKAARSRPRRANGQTVSDGFTPSYSQWQKHRLALLSGYGNLSDAYDLLIAATQQLRGERSGHLAFVVPDVALTEDIGGTLRQLSRNAGSTGDLTRLHVLPRLQQQYVRE